MLSRFEATTETMPPPSSETLRVDDTERMVENTPSSRDVTSASTVRAEAPG